MAEAKRYVADINKERPLKIYKGSEHKILPGGTIFN